MSDVRQWLAGRRPVPPMALEAWIPARSPELLAGLTEHGVLALGRARRRPGRVRDSAFDLLVADALLSYACEAALELPDPELALRRILLAAAATS